jgi:hypothetical protein
VIADAGGGQGPPRLIVIQRRSRALLFELRQQIAARVGAAPRWDRVVVERVGDEKVAGRPPREQDGVICRLAGDGVLVWYRLLPASALPPEPPRSDELGLLPLYEYRRRHWASPEAGYLAIGGKLSPEEEEQLLAAIVGAFDLNPDAAPPAVIAPLRIPPPPVAVGQATR